MIILPDRNIVRTKLLLPVPERTWRTPSQAQVKDQLGNENCVRFRVRARLADGYIPWIGWFESREDFDRFLWAIATGELWRDSYVQRLPTPWWPGLDPQIGYEFATLVFLTTPTGSNQTYTSAADWNNSNNSIETLGAGASGGAAWNASSNRTATGGGGGAWNKISNFTFAVPGTTTATWQAGAPGAAVSRTTTGATNGNLGGDTWFNGTTLAVSSVGSKGGSPGAASSASTAALNGGVGGVGASGVGTSNNNGGRGGNLTGTASANISVKTGAGGAAGSTGAGNAGGDTASPAVTTTTAGGSGDGGSGGAGGTATTAGTDGGNGTEWDASHGSGGGSSGTTSGTTRTGGNYGGAGGGAASTSGTITSGVGTQGIVVLTYTPAAIVTMPFNSDPWAPPTPTIISYRPN